ncbi:glucose-6-phosphate isomerase [Hirschia litorea]|uniref:Glucose-6-phosphate isomerase n=1 Tax=Hirschia litorea TaxID=1199156 RepID=A0ABW2IGU3_9PROT
MTNTSTGSHQALKDIVREDGRGERFVWKGPHVEADVTRQPLSEAGYKSMLKFAEEQKLADAIKSLFAGDSINGSEQRPALHWALRGNAAHLAKSAEFAEQAKACGEFATKVRSGGLGYKVKTILHIGIGGSDLGPRLIWDALRPLGHEGPALRFCANVDPADFAEATEGLDAETTLVIVVSKSFKTPETQANAQLAREWLISKLGEDQLMNHMAAVSSAPDLAQAWGAPADRIFPMDSAVGGRYSVWSSVGLSLMIALGNEAWAEFLGGGSDMDVHFRDAPLEENLPARLAMMDYHVHSQRGVPSRVVLAYAHRLRKLPDFLQQLEMESNGKSAASGRGVKADITAPITWGSVGTLGQHSFHQLLHQGTDRSAAEFVVAMNAGVNEGYKANGQSLLANAYAQAEAFLVGRSEAEAEVQLREKGVDEATIKARAPHMHMEGGRASSMFILDDISPRSVGALIAMYEHRTFAYGMLLGINPFDQWGVELGKVMAEEIDNAISGTSTKDRDATTLRLIKKTQDARA